MLVSTRHSKFSWFCKRYPSVTLLSELLINHGQENSHEDAPCPGATTTFRVLPSISSSRKSKEYTGHYRHHALKHRL